MIIPNGWIWTTVGEVTEPIRKVMPSENPDREFIYLDISSIDNIVNRITSPKVYKGSEAPSRARQLVQANDVLFSTVRTYLKNIALVPEVFDGQIASTGFSVLRAKPVTTGKYLFYYSLTNAFIKSLSNIQRGTSYPAVRDNDVREQPIPLPPLPEQERIVALIEELVTQLEAGVASLRRVKAALKRYKASLLKMAMVGKLSYSNDVGKSEGELPEEWQLVKLGTIFVLKIGGTPSRSTPEYWNGNIPWVSSGEVRNLRIKETRELITKEGVGNSNAKLCPPGTVLLAMIGEGKTRGQAAILDIEATINQNIAAILPNQSNAIPEWIFYWLLSRYEETRKSGSGGMQYALNSERVRNFVIPLPPLDEQQRIVAEVERCLTVAAQVEEAVGAGLKRAERLRQVILKRAFEGRLV